MVIITFNNRGGLFGGGGLFEGGLLTSAEKTLGLIQGGRNRDWGLNRGNTVRIALKILCLPAHDHNNQITRLVKSYYYVFE